MEAFRFASNPRAISETRNDDSLALILVALALLASTAILVNDGQPQSSVVQRFGLFRTRSGRKQPTLPTSNAANIIATNPDNHMLQDTSGTQNITNLAECSPPFQSVSVSGPRSEAENQEGYESNEYFDADESEDDNLGMGLEDVLAMIAPTDSNDLEEIRNLSEIRELQEFPADSASSSSSSISETNSEGDEDEDEETGFEENESIFHSASNISSEFDGDRSSFDSSALPRRKLFSSFPRLVQSRSNFSANLNEEAPIPLNSHTWRSATSRRLKNIPRRITKVAPATSLVAFGAMLLLAALWVFKMRGWSYLPRFWQLVSRRGVFKKICIPKVSDFLIVGMFFAAAKRLGNSLRIRSFFSNSNTSDECVFERLSGADEGITVITFNRPEARNALGKTFMSQFRKGLAQLRFDESVRVVVLRSSVDRVFCAGADLKERAQMTPQEVSIFVHGLRSAFTEVETLPVPTIAAIDGAALGGGLEVALAADIRVAGAGAKLGLPETKLAIIPGAGGTQRLPRLIGVSKAKELVFTGRVLDAKSAFNIGLVNHAVEGIAYEKAIAIAREILPAGPIATKLAKQAIDKGSQVDLATGMAIEQGCYAQVIPTEDRLEGLRAFREKRTPVYKGK
ncbi:hypothetical protein HK100_002662 [Physocladia obscura]|uniref:Uncharacterized protein n=1 Tax=Physocladia obscura TaxID=109957 RepID=A0AAD5SVH2_9FUNG|nr:hypothetical protein HK100_002662 [Physocladia obscura]